MIYSSRWGSKRFFVNRMLRKLFFASLLVPLILSVACSKGQKDTKGDAAGDGVQSQPVTLQTLNQRLTVLEFSVSTLANYDSHNIPAAVSCAETGASMAHTAMGSFPVSCESATSYLDGYKVKFRIDNIAFAEFDGVNIHVDYGASYSLSHDENSTAVLRPGHSTFITVMLTPATSSDVKTMLVKLDFPKWQVYR